MATAVVAPLLEACDTSADARKRRREILSCQRNLLPEVISSTEPGAKRVKLLSDDDDDSSDSSHSLSHKKPQMKYDPATPMTKEQAAAWRREQRRKRNRESAAASRQRQRDRIHELQDEVDGWKLKYEEIMTQVRLLDGSTEGEMPDLPTRSETPPAVQTVTPRASPTSTTSLVSLTGDDKFMDIRGREQEEEPIKMISRPAQSRIIHT
jgi:hypothetical protein